MSHDCRWEGVCQIADGTACRATQVGGSVEFASFHRLESMYQQELIDLAELKQSLLQRTFSSELPGGKEASTAALKEEVA